MKNMILSVLICTVLIATGGMAFARDGQLPPCNADQIAKAVIIVRYHYQTVEIRQTLTGPEKYVSTIYAYKPLTQACEYKGIEAADFN